MASLTMGSAMPDVSTTQTTSTVAPEWYNNFLSGLSTTGQNAVQQGGVAGFSGLQTQAFNSAPTAVNAGAPALQTGVNTATGVSQNNVASMIPNYLNPYTASVVNEIGRLGERNFRNNLAPGATAGAVGSGQFGSKRGMEVYGNLARENALDTTGQQSKALLEGWNSALRAAGDEETRDLQAAQILGALGGQQYSQGVGGLDVLSKLGAQQQAQEQARLDYPMKAATNYSNLLRGFQVPMTTTQNYKGPMPGAYNPSGLQQILQLLSTAGVLFTPGAGGKTPADVISGIGGGIYDKVSGGLASLLQKAMTPNAGGDYDWGGFDSTPLPAGDSDVFFGQDGIGSDWWE